MKTEGIFGDRTAKFRIRKFAKSLQIVVEEKDMAVFQAKKVSSMTHIRESA